MGVTTNWGTWGGAPQAPNVLQGIYDWLMPFARQVESLANRYTPPASVQENPELSSARAWQSQQAAEQAAYERQMDEWRRQVAEVEAANRREQEAYQQRLAEAAEAERQAREAWQRAQTERAQQNPELASAWAWRSRAGETAPPAEPMGELQAGKQEMTPAQPSWEDVVRTSAMLMPYTAPTALAMGTGQALANGPYPQEQPSWREDAIRTAAVLAPYTTPTALAMGTGQALANEFYPQAAPAEQPAGQPPMEIRAQYIAPPGTQAERDAYVRQNPELALAHQFYTPQHNPFTPGTREHQAVAIYASEYKRANDAYRSLHGRDLPAINALALWETVQQERGTDIDKAAHPPLTNASGWDKDRAPDTVVPKSDKEYSGLTGKPTSGDLATLEREGTVARDKEGRLWFVAGAYAGLPAERWQGDVEFIDSQVKEGKWSEAWAREYWRLINQNTQQKLIGLGGIAKGVSYIAGQIVPLAGQTIARAQAATSGTSRSPYGGYSYPSYRYGYGGEGGNETTPVVRAYPGWNRAWTRMRI